MSYKYMGADGYYLDNNNIDSLGIDHSGFSTRDELEYQYNRITNRDKMQPNTGYGAPAPSALSALTNQYKNGFNGGYTPSSQWGLFPQQSSFTGTQYAQLATPNTMSDASTAQPVDYSRYGEGFSPEFVNRMLNDTRFQQAMRNRTQRNEGGYSDNSADRGGPTNYGISSRWYPNEDIANLTPERASAILYRDYWLNPGINQLPDRFADIVFDDAVVQGPSAAIEILQNALGITADGLIGPNTLNASLQADNNVRQGFAQGVRQRAIGIAERNPSQRRFLNGWLNRADTY